MGGMERKKIEALKVQLKFRQLILEQPAVHPKTYAYSDKVHGKYSSDILIMHLKELIASTPSSVEIDSPLVGKHINHRFKSEKVDMCKNQKEEDAIYQGFVIGTVPGFPSWYNVKYDGDSAIYTYYKLELDMDGPNPDLVIVQRDTQNESDTEMYRAE